MRAALRVFSNPTLPPVGFCSTSMWLAPGNPVSWDRALQFRQGSAGRGSVWGGRNDECLKEDDANQALRDLAIEKHKVMHMHMQSKERRKTWSKHEERLATAFAAQSWY